ncbi:hypothetical protein HCUR_01173 [Holospora curviuscula]|uniref:Uncharacterized protein n=1 Tax=Holospora curviuscula TaxID=1082868 RepID=A0A2S5R7Q9_9PROT|nr:hypothetical protein HCUR_01173 [Holospora curviuscula]
MKLDPLNNTLFQAIISLSIRENLTTISADFSAIDGKSADAHLPKTLAVCFLH